MTLPRLSRLALLTVEAEVAELQHKAAQPPYRYALRPRTSERLYLSDDESWEITAVHDNGLRIEATDRIGRHRVLVRSERGCWPVIPARIG